MDCNKICFITCVNDERLYEESLLYIKQFNIPQGIALEFITVHAAESLASAYNQAMNSSDAKYKVYLHQDAFIVHRDFLADMLAIFQHDPTIGLLGMAGSKVMSTTGCWWDSEQQYGAIYDSSSGKMTGFRNIEGTEPYQEVQALDGVLIATQYDVPWREDLFTGWHFYDVSQCVEFKRAGYKAVVPNQMKTWCIHDSGKIDVDEKYEKYRNVFLDEYSKDLFPLVSILIPTYNRPHYFIQALESALNQTYRNIEIIVGDDSTNEETKKAITPYLAKCKNICYFYHGGPLGATGGKNFQFVFKQAKGEYVNWLMDDDLFYPEKISMMMKCYLEKPNVSLVTSNRNLIDQDGRKLPNDHAKMVEDDVLIDGGYVARYMMDHICNLIGEPTTVLIKKSFLSPAYGKKTVFFGAYAKFLFNGLSDMMTWLEFSKKGDIFFIATELSAFRNHLGQKTHNPIIVISAVVDYFNFISITYLENEYIKDELEYEKYCDLWLKGYHHEFALRCVKEVEADIDRYGVKDSVEWFLSYYKTIFGVLKKRNYKAALNYFVCLHADSHPPYKALEKLCVKRNGLWQRADDRGVNDR